MFARLSRLFRAWMGFFISAAEDPEVMLQDAIEEMRMTMPKLNSVLVATRATVDLAVRPIREPHRPARGMRHADGVPLLHISIEANFRLPSPAWLAASEDLLGNCALRMLRRS